MKDKPKAHLVVIEQVYYQMMDGGQPTSTELRYTRWLDTDEQPFVRRTKVGSEWTPLETGWVKRASLLVLHNEGEEREQGIPSPTMKAELASRVIEVRFNGITVAVIRPGESMRLEPVCLKYVVLRCQKGTTRLTVTLIPG